MEPIVFDIKDEKIVFKLVTLFNEFLEQKQIIPEHVNKNYINKIVKISQEKEICIINFIIPKIIFYEGRITKNNIINISYYFFKLSLNGLFNKWTFKPKENIKNDFKEICSVLRKPNKTISINDDRMT